MTCPAEHELTRALQVGDPGFALHLTECARCRELRNGLERAIALARELAADVPPPAHREEVRTALLAIAEASPRPGRRPGVRVAWLGAAGVAAIAALWLTRPAHDAPVRQRVSVVATPGAIYAMSGDLVRLHQGTLDLDVEPLRPGERFRVVVGDGEVEVRGTQFDVTAAGDHLVTVRVMRGRVEIRVGGATTLLDPGQTWHVPVPAPPRVIPPPAPPLRAPPPLSAKRATTPVAVTAAKPPARRPQLREIGTALVALRSPEDAAYDDAWDAMRAGDFRKAAAGFARVHALSPAGVLADDAAFWTAVALARDGRGADAIAAFRNMLDGYPNSPRAGEASAMLGWLLVDAHQLDEAAKRFAAAADHPNEAVRASARKGLEELRVSADSASRSPR
jgi:tetratricopeptide (TPR) repeat protein